jgi:hypothetical protein
MANIESHRKREAAETPYDMRHLFTHLIFIHVPSFFLETVQTFPQLSFYGSIGGKQINKYLMGKSILQM